jgi:beta-RFAP synthase
VPSVCVSVTTGARLHFGPLAAGATSGRQFGGLGVMIQDPGLEVVVQRGVQNEILADEDWTDRIRSTLDTISNQLPPPARSGFRVELRKVPPAHCGFGTGTQLALAIAAGVCRAAGQSVPPAFQLAQGIGRGGRSALGIHGFDQGGLLLEAGKLPGQAVGCLVARTELPRDWRWVLVRPRNDVGVSGSEEVSAFASLPPMSGGLTAELCGLVVREILPAAQERDFRGFAEGLWEYGHRVGEYFAPVQGGVFAHPQARTLAAALRERGVPGVAQTSWGPTLAVIQPHERDAADLIRWLSRDPIGGACQVICTRPLNHGAMIQVHGDQDGRD